jgi:hypothetical protein
MPVLRGWEFYLALQNKGIVNEEIDFPGEEGLGCCCLGELGEGKIRGWRAVRTWRR